MRIQSIKKKNHLRDMILSNNYMPYIGSVDISDRNKAIVKDYASGLSQKELASKYSITKNRIHQIIADYVSKIHKIEDRKQSKKQPTVK